MMRTILRNAGAIAAAAIISFGPFSIILFFVLVPDRPACAQESTDGIPADIEEQETVDINRAGLDELLEIPGMDPDLARTILAYRAEAGPFDSVDALCGSPSITPARLLPVRPWLTAERVTKPFVFDLSAAARSASSPPLRREMKFAAGRGPFHLAVRARSGLPDSDPPTSTLLSSVARARPVRWLTLTVGDIAPVDGFGILLGISGRPAPGGALALPPAYGWNAAADGSVRLNAPAPDGRFLRGAAATVGRHIVAGIFDYHAGGTTPSQGDRPIGPARAAFFGVRVGDTADGSRSRTERVLRRSAPDSARAQRASGRSLSARTAIFDGRLWLGALVQFRLAGGRVAFEAARDPEGRGRYAMACEARASRNFLLRFSRIGGSRGFINPLGRDSERAPLSGERLDTGANENREETAFTTRIIPLRRIAVEFEVRGAIDPATSRRAWDRPVGTGIARFEASPGGGWSVVAETRVENRGAPGPSTEADAPIRRHSARLIAGWQKGRTHLRLEWQGRLDFEVPNGGATTAALGKVQDLVAVRARLPVGTRFWLGAGVANYRLPSDAPAVLYEERPAGLPPAIFVRGTEQRVHLAVGGRFKWIEAGAFISQRRATFSQDTSDVSWGSTLRLRNGG